MKKKIEQYFQKKRTRVLLQTRVPKELRDEVNDLRKKNGHKWNEVIAAGLRFYIEIDQDSKKLK